MRTKVETMQFVLRKEIEKYRNALTDAYNVLMVAAEDCEGQQRNHYLEAAAKIEETLNNPG